jgi:hypothetical protein
MSIELYKPDSRILDNLVRVYLDDGEALVAHCGMAIFLPAEEFNVIERPPHELIAGGLKWFIDHWLSAKNSLLAGKFTADEIFKEIVRELQYLVGRERVQRAKVRRTYPERPPSKVGEGTG